MQVVAVGRQQAHLQLCWLWGVERRGVLLEVWDAWLRSGRGRGDGNSNPQLDKNWGNFSFIPLVRPAMKIKDILEKFLVCKSG